MAQVGLLITLLVTLFLLMLLTHPAEPETDEIPHYKKQHYSCNCSCNLALYKFTKQQTTSLYVYLSFLMSTLKELKVVVRFRE